MASSSRSSSKNAPPSPTLADHIDQNIESVVALQRREWETVSHAQRRVERVGRFIGRPVYLVALLLAVLMWVLINLRPGAAQWDRPPFELLDGLMTLISLLTTTIVLIAQNRQTKLEQQHTHLGLQVALLTEQKVSKLITLIEELRRDLPNVRNRHDPHAEALQETANTERVVSALEEIGATTTMDSDSQRSAGGRNPND